MSQSLLQELMQALRVLPGVGKRTAQRMAFHVLQREPESARQLAQVMERALDQIRPCRACRTLTEQPLCNICSGSTRNSELLCVVETPADQMSIEDLGQYNGYYFVLHGHLSPLDRIGPKEIGVDQLLARVTELGVREVILATNFTLEGEATAGYLSSRLREQGVSSSRLAHGVPSGGELEYIDQGTLARAIAERRQLRDSTPDPTNE